MPGVGHREPTCPQQTGGASREDQISRSPCLVVVGARAVRLTQIEVPGHPICRRICVAKGVGVLVVERFIPSLAEIRENEQGTSQGRASTPTQSACATSAPRSIIFFLEFDGPDAARPPIAGASPPPSRGSAAEPTWACPRHRGRHRRRRPCSCATVARSSNSPPEPRSRTSIEVRPTLVSTASNSTRSPIRMGCLKTTESIATVTTRRCAWRMHASAPASSISFKIQPPCTLPTRLACSGCISCAMLMRDARTGFPSAVVAIRSFPPVGVGGACG